MIDISIDGFIKQLATSRAVRVRTHAWWLQNKVLHKSKVQSFFCLLKSWCIHFVSCFTIATQWLQYTYIYIYIRTFICSIVMYTRILCISLLVHIMLTQYTDDHTCILYVIFAQLLRGSESSDGTSLLQLSAVRRPHATPPASPASEARCVGVERSGTERRRVSEPISVLWIYWIIYHLVIVGVYSDL